MEKLIKGLLLCEGGMSSSWIAGKLNEIGKKYNIHLEEGGLAATNMNEVVKNYDVVLLAPHLRAAYEDYEDLFEEKNIPLIQIQQTEYSGTEIASKKLFERVLKEMKLK